jgi:hypothetical protein
MSILAAIPSSVKRQALPYTLPYAFSKEEYVELGVCYAENGVLTRNVSFKKIREAIDFLLTTSFTGALIYANNPLREFGENSFSPLLINENYAIASCGNVLQLSELNTGQSNLEVFVDQVLKPCAIDAPDLFQMKPFAWMMGEIARSFVGIAFLKSDGHIQLVHSKLFNKTMTGYFYMDFEFSKNRLIKPYKPRK